jgi:uncharacterized protein YndB with AHSA1/START domain
MTEREDSGSIDLERRRPTVSRVVKATPGQVWDVLADGWIYPVWVVGATRMRAVDDHWPSAGARLHHSAGVWPAAVDDETEVLEVEPGRRLSLRAAGWPLGEAEVVLTLEPADEGTTVTISERASSGPGRLVPRLLHDPVIAWRNSETLRRLAFLAEGRARSR